MSNVDRVMSILETYGEDGDGYARYFHGVSREAHENIVNHGFVGRVEESDLEYTEGNEDCVYVSRIVAADQCFEYAGVNGVIYVFEYTGEGHDDVYSNGSGSEYLLPVKSPSFRVYGYYDLSERTFTRIS